MNALPPDPADTPNDSAWADRVALGVLALMAAAGLATFRDFGLGWDDFTHSQFGELLLAFYGSGFTDRRAFSFVNLYYYGGAFDMAAALLAKVLPFDLFETRRLTGALVGVLGLAVTWRIGRRVGGPVAGLFALVLLAACPLYVGHAMINAKDAPFAVAMAVLLLGIVRALDQYPRPCPTTVALVGLGLGFSLGSRVMGGFGVIAALTALGLIVALDARREGARPAIATLGAFALRLLPAALLGYVVLALIWPWAVIDPLNPFRALAYFSHFFEKPWRELFWGVLTLVPNMPRIYVPTLLAVRLPEIMLVASLAGCVLAMGTVLRAPTERRTRAVHLAVLLFALLPVAVAIATRPAMYNGLRHFIFILPPLAVLGGLAGAALAARLANIGRHLRATVAAIALAALMLPISDLVRLHPFQYVSYNRLVGGVEGARPLFMLDYWGLSLKPAAQGLRETLERRGERPPAGRSWRVTVCGPHSPANVALGPGFETTWETKGADFALMLGEFYCARLDAPLIGTVEREGITFASVYDLRGRSVPSIFAFPPVERDPEP